MHFLIASVVSFAFGVIIADKVGDGLVVSLWLLVIALGVGLVRRRRGEASSAPYLLLTSLSLIFLTLGLLRTELFSSNFNQSSLSEKVGQEVEIIGVVSAEPDYRQKTVMLYVDTSETRVLVSTDKYQEFSYGDEVRVVGDLEIPTNFTSDLGREFDYQRYLKIREVEFRISFAEVEILSGGNSNEIISSLLIAKKTFVSSVQNFIPEPAVGLGNGLLLGIKSALGDDIEEDFRRTGIVHIVVLSGYNVMLVVSFIMFFLAFFLPLKWRMIFGVLAIVMFALIVGLSATVVRASIMASLVLVAQAYGRQYDVLRALWLAGLIMLLVNPFLIYDIGFQLSFMATLGLILIVPKFETKIISETKLLNWREFLLATIATQIAVFPLLLYHIGEISLIAVVVNLLVLPMVPLAMLLTFATGILGLFSYTLATWIGYLATASLNYILFVAQVFADLPFATMTMPEFSWYWIIIMYLGIGIAFFYFDQNRQQEKNEFADWLIEEEDSLKKAGEQSSPANDTPIFFR